MNSVLDAGPKLKLAQILFAGFLLLHLGIHPFGHQLFAPLPAPPNWAADPAQGGQTEFVHGPDECLLCRGSAGLVARPVPAGYVGLATNWSWIALPAHFHPSQPSLLFFAVRAPPVL